MKRFLSIGTCVACLSLLIIVGHKQALTAKISPPSDPIKILGVKLNKVETQASWLDGLEVAVENTSGKPIRYLVIQAELPAVTANGKSVEVPLTFGYAPVPNAKRDFQFFQPGTKLNVKVSKSVCEKVRSQLAANGHALTSTNDIQIKTHLVIFENKTAWAGGQLHYPDPKDPTKWIAAEELARNRLLQHHSRTVNLTETTSTSSSNPQTCYRTTGFHLQYCCSDFGGGGAENPYYVGSLNFTGDPSGHVQPKEAEACCQEGDCCSYTDLQGCP